MSTRAEYAHEEHARTAHSRNDTTQYGTCTRRGAHAQTIHVLSMHVQAQILLQVECDCVSFL